jgi:hypothetical protein
MGSYVCRDLGLNISLSYKHRIQLNNWGTMLPCQIMITAIPSAINIFFSNGSISRNRLSSINTGSLLCFENLEEIITKDQPFGHCSEFG